MGCRMISVMVGIGSIWSSKPTMPNPEAQSRGSGRPPASFGQQSLLVVPYVVDHLAVVGQFAGAAEDDVAAKVAFRLEGITDTGGEHVAAVLHLAVEDHHVAVVPVVDDEARAQDLRMALDDAVDLGGLDRSEEPTSELRSLK